MLYPHFTTILIGIAGTIILSTMIYQHHWHQQQQYHHGAHCRHHLNDSEDDADESSRTIPK